MVCDPPNTSEEGESTGIPDIPSLHGLFDAIVNIAAGWATLFKHELALAHQCLRLLLIGSIFLVVLCLSIWLSFNAFLVSVVQHFINSWIGAIAIVFITQSIVLIALLRQMRQWIHKITLPQSRAALVRTLERMK